MVRVVILTAGTYGDVVPFAGLGERLTVAGNEVTVATTARFADVVTSAGVRFHELPASDPRELAAGDEGRAAGRGGLRGMASATRTAAEVMRRPVPAMIEAVAQADVVLCTAATSLLAAPMAEARGLPCIVLTLQPTEPSRTHGPTLLGGRNLGGWLNRAVPATFARLGFRIFAGLIREVRDELGLPATPAEGYGPAELTVLYGISPTAYPPPPDLRPGVEVAGYWWPAGSAGSAREPDPALDDFLAAGPAPVYVGFGSMGAGDGPRLSAEIEAALRVAGCRAVVSRGWAGLQVDAPDVFMVGDVPHEWLFGRVAAVVHHAGAGTTAAGLRAGVPAVPVPFAYDQPFWARRVVELGAAPRALPAKRLTGADLGAAIATAVTDSSYRHAAAEVAARLASEDGAARVIEFVDLAAR